jgi:hypothetical protein
MYLDRKARQLADVVATTRVETPRQGEEIDERIACLARDERPGLIVLVGSSRATNPCGVVFGSIAQGVLRVEPLSGAGHPL